MDSADEGAKLSVANAHCSSDDSSCSEDSDSTSTADEERLRRLFETCDSDGDGFIDGQDLLVMCRQLNMEECANEVIHQLGGDSMGRITFQDFARCRRKVRYEINAAVKQHEEELNNESLEAKLCGVDSAISESLPSLQQNMNSWPRSIDTNTSLGTGYSSTARESWDHDSGARDLSPEPGAYMQKMVDGTRKCSKYLDMANRKHRQELENIVMSASSQNRQSRSNAEALHLAALASLKGEIIELKHRLQSTAIERDGLERKLAKAQVERSRLIHENDDRLEQQAIRYEERITELHSVIAELNKKIDRTQGDTIREEDEFSQSASSPPSNISNSGGSCNGSCFHGSESIQIDQCNDLNAELTRVFEGIECSIPSRTELHQHVASMEQQAQQLDSASKQSQQRALQVMKEVEALNLDSSSDVDQAAKMQRRRSSLEQELRILQEENENLNTSISRKDDEMLKMKANLMTVREEREKFRRKVREMQAMISTLQNQNGNHRTGHSSSSEHLGSPTQRPSPAPSHTGINPSTGELSLTGSERKKEMAVSKVAERVKLKQSRSADLKPGHDPRQVLGHEISAAGIQNSKLAEHLAHSLQECSSLQEVFQTLNSHGLSIPENKVREFEVEMERLNSKIEHLKSQNDLLSLTLEESKANCDRLSMLVGKYESNNTALQMAVNYSDQTIEALKTQLDLAQCEQQSLLANCKAAGLGGLGENSESSGDDSEDTTSMLRRVHENKKIAESMAKSLLQRLDRSCGAVLTHVQGAALQPWEDVSSQSHTSTTSSTASSCDTEFSKEDEQRLKDYVQQLKNDRAAVRLTVMELESVHIDPLSHDVAPRQDTQRLDLENAVLMQELTALKEERAELKAQNYLQDKERKALELKLSSREAQEEAYLVQINNLKCEMKEQMSHHSSGSDKGGFTRPHYAKNGISSPVSLAEVQSLDDHSVASQDEFMQREKKMKSRIQELVTTLEKVQKSSELRHQQSSEFVADLKRANSALVTAYEKAKKKHQSRLKKLEAQMLAMVERHDTQVRMLKQRIALLEEENQATRRPHNETSL